MHRKSYTNYSLFALSAMKIASRKLPGITITSFSVACHYLLILPCKDKHAFGYVLRSGLHRGRARIYFGSVVSRTRLRLATVTEQIKLASKELSYAWPRCKQRVRLGKV